MQCVWGRSCVDLLQCVHDRGVSEADLAAAEAAESIEAAIGRGRTPESYIRRSQRGGDVESVRKPQSVATC